MVRRQRSTWMASNAPRCRLPEPTSSMRRTPTSGNAVNQTNRENHELKTTRSLIVRFALLHPRSLAAKVLAIGLKSAYREERTELAPEGINGCEWAPRRLGMVAGARFGIGDAFGSRIRPALKKGLQRAFRRFGHNVPTRAANRSPAPRIADIVRRTRPRGGRVESAVAVAVAVAVGRCVYRGASVSKEWNCTATRHPLRRDLTAI